MDGHWNRWFARLSGFALPLMFSLFAHADALADEFTDSAGFCARPWSTLCVADSGSPRAVQKRLTQIRTDLRTVVLAQVEKSISAGGCGVIPRADTIQAYRGMGYSNAEARRLAVLDRIHDVGNGDAELCLAKMVEGKVFAQLNGVATKASISQIFERVRAALLAEIHVELDSLPDLRPTRDAMLASIQKVQLIFSDRYLEWAKLNVDRTLPGAVPSIAAITNLDGGMCGPELLRRNSFASSTGYTPKTGPAVHTGMLAVLGCPGQWLDLLSVQKGGIASNLYHVFGHEMAHQIHVNWNRAALGQTDPEGHPISYDTVPAYQQMIPCLQHDYEPIFPKVSDAWVDQMHDQYKKVLGREPTPIDYKSNEVVADYWGTRVMARLVSEDQSSDNRLSGVMNGLRRFCFVEATTDLSVAHSDTHPSGQFRVEFALKEPALRAALGCTLSGEVENLGARASCEVNPPQHWELVRRNRVLGDAQARL